MRIITLLRKEGFSDDNILAFLFGRFADPEPVRIIVEDTIATLGWLRADKEGKGGALDAAYHHFCRIAGVTGRLTGSLKYVEHNWSESLATSAKAIYEKSPKVRAMISGRLTDMAADEPNIERDHDFLHKFIEHFAITPLSDTKTLPSRLVDPLEKASDGLLSMGTECHAELVNRFPDMHPHQDIRELYNEVYLQYCGLPAAGRPWQEITWGLLDFDTTLGYFDFSATAISKGVCRFCAIILVIASTASLIASYILVNPVLTTMSIPGLIIGAALAIKPEVATRLAEKYLSKRK